MLPFYVHIFFLSLVVIRAALLHFITFQFLYGAVRVVIRPHQHILENQLLSTGILCCMSLHSLLWWIAQLAQKSPPLGSWGLSRVRLRMMEGAEARLQRWHPWSKFEDTSRNILHVMFCSHCELDTLHCLYMLLLHVDFVCFVTVSCFSDKIPRQKEPAESLLRDAESIEQ